MVATITLNPAFDKTYVISCFEYGGTNIVKSTTNKPGGKGINVSRALLGLGVDSLAIGLAGREFVDAVKGENIDEDFVITDMATRTNVKILDTAKNVTTELNDVGQPVSDNLLCLVQERFEKHLAKDDIAVFSGSLPPGAPCDIYKQWIDMCHHRGIISILDGSGPALLEGLKAIPHIVKPNLSELEFFAGKKLRDINDICSAAYELVFLGIKLVIVSMGSKGAMLVSKDSAFFGQAPSIKAKSTVGAGDAMVAACIFAKVNNLSESDLLKVAISAGSTSAKTGGIIKKSQVIKLMEKVEIGPLPKSYILNPIHQTSSVLAYCL